MKEILEKTIIVDENSIPSSMDLFYSENRVHYRASEITFRTKSNRRLTIYAVNNPTNCKLITIEGINQFGYYSEIEFGEFLLLINYIVGAINAYGNPFFIHVTDYRTITFLEKHFEKVYVNKAFIRGTYTPQYHGCFMPKQSYLLTKLKMFQSKKPHVIIKEKITKKELLKLTNYKQEKRKKDFLEKLIERYE